VALAIDNLVLRPYRYTSSCIQVHTIYTGCPNERERGGASGRDEMRGRKSVLSSVTNQIPDIIVRYKPTHPLAPFLPLSPAPHRVRFCNVNLVHNLHALQRLRLITTASVCGRVRECCTMVTMVMTTTTTTRR